MKMNILRLLYDLLNDAFSAAHSHDIIFSVFYDKV